MTTIYRFFAEKRPGFDIEAQGLLSTLQGYLHIEGLQGCVFSTVMILKGWMKKIAM